jgi:hypothetical protein
MPSTNNTSKGRKSVRRTNPSSRRPTPVENPSWLTGASAGPAPDPPVSTRPVELPLLRLTWENFERLCYRVAQKSGHVEKAWAYGSQGHRQLGIDVLVRTKMGHLKLGKANAIKRSAQLNYWLPFNISSIVNGLKQPRNLSLLWRASRVTPELSMRFQCD